MRRLPETIVLTILCVLPASLSADIIFLKNSRYYKGKVTGQDLNNVLFTTKDGLKLSISKKTIRKIIYIPVSRQSELDEEAKKRAEERRKRAQAEKERRRRLEQERIQKQRLEAERRRKAAEEARRKRAAAEKAREEKDRSRRRESLWRSAVLPGWGQHYLGAKKRGYYFGGAFAGAVFLWFIFDRRYNAAIADHDESTVLALAGASNTALAAVGFLGVQEARADADKQAAWATRFSWIFIGVYLYNLYDVYYNYSELVGASANKGVTRDGGFAFSIFRRPVLPAARSTADEDHFTFSYGFRF